MKEASNKTVIYRPVIKAAAGALVAHACGYDFNFIGLPPDHEPPGSVSDVVGVGYPFEDVVAGWEHQLVMLRVGLGTKLITDIVRGRDLDQADVSDASYLDDLLKSEASNKPRTCKLVDAPQYALIRDNPRAVEYIGADACRWGLGLVRQEWAVPVLWTLCCRVEERKTVPRWTLDLMRRTPDKPPREFLELDWRQEGLRKVIEQRLQEMIG